MSIEVQRSEMDATGLVAEEVRALMARRRITGRELARRLSVSPSWVSYRLTGSQPIDVNDLRLIARTLGVTMAALLPSDERIPTSQEEQEDRPSSPRRRDPLAQRVVAKIGSDVQFTDARYGPRRPHKRGVARGAQPVAVTA